MSHRISFIDGRAEVHELTRFDQVKSATLPCARITLIKFQGVISADFRANDAKASTPSVYGHVMHVQATIVDAGE